MQGVGGCRGRPWLQPQQALRCPYALPAGCLLLAPATANLTWNSTHSPFPPPPPPSRVTLTPISVESHRTTAAHCCSSDSNVVVKAGPTSRTFTVGDHASLECEFKAPREATVTWNRVYPRKNCSAFFAPVNVSCSNCSVVRHEDRATLAFHHVGKDDAGLYFCRVEAGWAAGQSCGTYLRVRKPVAMPFLNLKESTKNRIITAEGILLLLCTVGPGLFLFFQKRWANERLLQSKKGACEEENLYEGLNLDECSMYEDISRGLQPTYQDVGSLGAGDTQLEKP
ncbi:B-cell antigen receptor complex-associated protein alpha chain [Rhea pennata]|uniref:B-cell antigen receptor complex-associated protein alpha chain n=1 Tax=Rhea pennata TaxID=8795 RepID=UPI002E258FB7